MFFFYNLLVDFFNLIKKYIININIIEFLHYNYSGISPPGTNWKDRYHKLKKLSVLDFIKSSHHGYVVAV